MAIHVQNIHPERDISGHSQRRQGEPGRAKEVEQSGSAPGIINEKRDVHVPSDSSREGDSHVPLLLSTDHATYD